MIVKTRRFSGRLRQKVRMDKLRLNPLCEQCHAKGLVVLATEVDHVVPLFKGGQESVDPMVNKQSLCVDCHKSKTANDMGHKARYGCDAKGLPLDPNHHWNQV